ncbi:Flp family type IVb pilin [Pseudoduganella chitinolytica]|uniref:Flp family type IVb pilin n=1 Tax=Pseudoduganella chitinolytica TaxID=34070 RepID=A0ABY8B8Q1_9BURK|nr:Flp family type IVb pilin [Pseudoduganella chitinolytica]WEF32312.1 Flp family type IVb pilin [Pseudoduganella chitinolytica]
MKALIVAARDFARDEEGITAIEYGLIAAVIAGVIGAAFTNVGAAIGTTFTKIATQLTGGAGTGTGP